MIFGFVTRSIRHKLMVAVSGVFILGLGGIVYMATQLQIQESESFVSWSLQRNLESRGERLKLAFQRLVDKSELSLKTQQISKSSGLEALKVLKWPSLAMDQELFSEGNADIVAKLNPSFSEEIIESMASSPESFVLQRKSQAIFQLSKRVGDDFLIAIYFDGETLSNLMKSEGLEEIALFDDQGQIFLESSNTKLSTSAMAGGTGLPREILSRLSFTSASSEQFPFWNQTGEKYIGSFYKTGISGTVLGAWVPYEVVLETPRKVARRSFYLGLSVLGIALLISMLFSNSLIRPILALVEATQFIADGNFSARLKLKTQDELSRLGNAFNTMASGLEEREKLKDLFGKFHSKAVVQKLMAEDKIRLGGERLPVTVFFSDIRSFTSTSENMDPEEVVEMLNEYMTEMVSVIEEEGGVVDKYVGDAIMAVWGLAKEAPVDSARSAVRACLKMRERLAALNEVRAGRGQKPIVIGMGLTSGEVIAGNIGSQSRMEYTVIGDTVNTASRMESLTKDNGTDFLIHSSTKEFVDGEFEFEGPIALRAKGKADDVQVYKVHGFSSASAGDEAA